MTSMNSAGDVASAVRDFYDDHSRYARWVGVVANVVAELEEHRRDEDDAVLVIRVDPTRMNEYGSWVVEAVREAPTSGPVP